MTELFPILDFRFWILDFGLTNELTLLVQPYTETVLQYFGIGQLRFGNNTDGSINHGLTG
jgi:hypothetical protein